MLNLPAAQPVVRQPRGIVRINNTENVFWESFEVENNNFYAADSFRVTLPVSSLPLDMPVSWFAEQQQIAVDIYAGFPGNPDRYAEADLLFLIHGNVDEMEYDPIGGMLHLSGRDNTALFIDNRTDEKFVNQTSSQIATLLAQRRGLNPVVTVTKTKVGRFFDNDASSLTRTMTEWDLLTWLAQEEGFQAYVTGNDLHFEPKNDSGDTFVLQWQPGPPPVFNGKSLRLAHNLTLAKDVVVKVKVLDMAQGINFTKTARAKHGKSGGQPQTFVYRYHGLTADQAQQRATDIALSIAQHEMRMDAVLPGDTLLTARTLVELRGTDTAFDQTYYPSHVRRRFDGQEGFVMELSAKNHATESMVTT